MKSKKIAILASGGANFASVFHALVKIGCSPLISKSIADLQKADAMILPGVGSAGFAMTQLKELGLADFLGSQQKPILGICLGKQLLCSSSQEEDATCLGVIPLKVQKLRGPRILPHMGWNHFIEIADHEPLLKGITPKDNFYFIHSYAAEIAKPSTIGICDYFGQFSAAIRRDNFFGVQFHPEKSGIPGLKILQNFIDIKV